MKKPIKTDHIVVSKSTLRTLKKIKREHDLASADAAIKYIINILVMKGGDK